MTSIIAFRLNNIACNSNDLQFFRWSHFKMFYIFPTEEEGEQKKTNKWCVFWKGCVIINNFCLAGCNKDCCVTPDNFMIDRKQAFVDATRCSCRASFASFFAKNIFYFANCYWQPQDIFHTLLKRNNTQRNKQKTDKLFSKIQGFLGYKFHFFVYLFHSPVKSRPMLRMPKPNRSTNVESGPALYNSVEAKLDYIYWSKYPRSRLLTRVGDAVVDKVYGGVVGSTGRAAIVVARRSASLQNEVSGHVVAFAHVVVVGLGGSSTSSSSR